MDVIIENVTNDWYLSIIYVYMVGADKESGKQNTGQRESNG